MASGNDSGRENAANSRSSSHGRCREHARWIEVLMRDTKVWNEGDRESPFEIWCNREDDMSVCMMLYVVTVREKKIS